MRTSLVEMPAMLGTSVRPRRGALSSVRRPRHVGRVSCRAGFAASSRVTPVAPRVPHVPTASVTSRVPRVPTSPVTSRAPHAYVKNACTACGVVYTAI